MRYFYFLLCLIALSGCVSKKRFLSVENQLQNAIIKSDSISKQNTMQRQEIRSLGRQVDSLDLLFNNLYYAHMTTIEELETNQILIDSLQQVLYNYAVNTDEHYYRNAIDLMYAGDYDAAITSLKQMIDKFPKSSLRSNAKQKIAEAEKAKQTATNSNNTPKVNNSVAGFKWGQGSGQGTGIGSGTGAAQGSVNASGTGPGDGVSQGPGNYNLASRRSNSIPTPKYNTQKEGRVVVSIWVDRAGIVVRAEAGAIGTTIADPMLWKECELAAMKAKFSEKEDAVTKQVGTITYVFINQN